MMVSRILQSSVVDRCFIRGVCCVSALLLGSQLPYELPPAAGAIHASPIAQQPDQEPRKLAPGNSLDGRLEAGQSHQYQAPLVAGEFIHVVVEQQGVDVEVTVFDPGGKQLLQVDSPNGQHGPELVSIVAETPGDHRLQVRSLGAAAGSGRYRIELKTKRMATPQDRERVKAQRTFLDAWLLEYQNDFRGAIKKFEDACHLFRRAGDFDGEAGGLNRIGKNHYRLREMQKASDALLRALSLHQDAIGKGEALDYLGDVYFSLGEREKALDSYNQALDLFRQARNPSWEAVALTDLGSYYHLLNEQQEALKFFNQALDISRQTRNRGGEAEAIHSLGVVYLSLGAAQQAKERFEAALRIREEAPNDYGRARTLTGLGVAHDDLGAKEKAEDCHNQALKLFRTLGYRVEEAIALNNLGQLYASLSRPQQALDYHNRALELRRKIGDKAGEAISLNNIGAAYESLGDKEEALKYYYLALPIYQDVIDRRREAITLALIARVERSAGRPGEALVRIDAALKIIEDLRVRVAGPELRASYFATAQNCYELNIDLLMQMDKEGPSGGYKAEALRISERARARSLLDLLLEARAGIRAGADSGLLERERKLELQLRLTPASSKREIEELLAQYREVKAQIRVSSPRYAALTQPIPLTLVEIQRLLDPETLLLEYSLGEARSYLWVVSQAELISCELPKREEVETAVERVYELLTARARRAQGETLAQRQARVAEADKQYWEQAAALSQTLLGPAAAHLGKKRLLIVAAGKLQLIPFAALPTPETEGRRDGGTERRRDGETEGRREAVSKFPSVPPSLRPSVSQTPLIVNHEIVSLPSASTLGALRREVEGRAPATKTVAIFADPAYSQSSSRADGMRAPAFSGPQWSVELSKDLIARGVFDASGGFQRLSYSLQEANGISSLAPMNQKLVATGFKASRANVMSQPLGQYRNVHFITHGVLDEERPELSSLVLSLVDEQGRPQDGYLRLHDIYNLSLTSTELVVLSACQTGLGKNVRGEGLVGLTRGFMYAGSPRVVASLWSVNDWGTSGLMKRFYEGMLGPRKLRPAAALRDAQEWMWRQRETPDWRAPYYWAAFTLQGEWK